MTLLFVLFLLRIIVFCSKNNQNYSFVPVLQSTIVYLICQSNGQLHVFYSIYIDIFQLDMD